MITRETTTTISIYIYIEMLYEMHNNARQYFNFKKQIIRPQIYIFEI
jgi:hypothetical protein